MLGDKGYAIANSRNMKIDITMIEPRYYLIKANTVIIFPAIQSNPSAKLN